MGEHLGLKYLDENIKIWWRTVFNVLLPEQLNMLITFFKMGTIKEKLENWRHFAKYLDFNVFHDLFFLLFQFSWNSEQTQNICIQRNKWLDKYSQLWRLVEELLRTF